MGTAVKQYISRVRFVYSKKIQEDYVSVRGSLMSNADGKLASGIAWSFLERFLSQGIGTVVAIILARIIHPEEYGIIAAVTIFTSIMTSFVTGGFGSALIQKKNAEDIDYSSMFIFNALFSVFAYFIVYFSAPYLVLILDESYDYELLIKVLRCLGIGVVFASFNSFFRNILAKEFNFKKIFFVALIGMLVSAVCGITMAYRGYGVWALVAQQVFSYAVNTLCFLFFSPWKPKLKFSFSRLKPMISFGGKLMLSTLLTTIYTDIYSIAIANQYSSDSLAFYKKGNTFPRLLVINIIASINTALFPVMAKMSTVQEYKSCVKRFNKLSTFIIAPMMFGFAAVAQNFVSLVLTDKWLPCVPFLQIACFNYVLQPIGIANMQFWKASGKATMYLIADIVKKIIGVGLLLMALRWSRSVISFATADLIATVFAVIITLAPAKKELGYSIYQQVRDVFPQFALSTIMFVAVIAVGNVMNLPQIIELLVQVLVGILIYIGGAKVSKMKELDDCTGYISSFLRARKKRGV